jgi:hypothetical protein
MNCSAGLGRRPKIISEIRGTRRSVRDDERWRAPVCARRVFLAMVLRDRSRLSVLV